jgi:S1-C subfamily serine protease
LAGLRELRIGGDVIVGVNGEQVNTRSDLNLLLNRARPGEAVTLTVVRGGRKMDVRVTLGEG